jgi:hypothetical protein
MEKDKLWDLLKRFLVISGIIALVLIKFTAKFMYVLLKALGEALSEYQPGSGWGWYSSSSSYRRWYWRRRMWE